MSTGGAGGGGSAGAGGSTGSGTGSTGGGTGTARPARPARPARASASVGRKDDLEAGGNNPIARAHEVADAQPDDQEDQLHQAFDALARAHSLGPAQTRELQAMIGTLSDLTKEGTSVGDLKIAGAALAEMTEAFRVFRPYRKIRKITMFGSARTLPEDPVYILARDLASHMARADWMVVTGAGPGIMAAGLEGAGREHAFGVNIRLPHEEGANVFIAQDPKLVEMRYFFTRKLMLIKESHAYAILPGGFGTQDEAFELLTLLQTGKAEPAPVVMLETPHGSYWQGWLRFLEEEAIRSGWVSPDDEALFKVTTSVEEATAEILGFYRNYHSCRWVGDLLVLRLQTAPSRAELADLNRRFGDIVSRGTIRSATAFPPERSSNDFPDLPRLALRFDKWHFARLRMLIDAINECTGA